MPAKKSLSKTASKKTGRSRTPATPAVMEDAKPYRASSLRFIDLFCGIGGFRIAFEKQGAKCVFSSDYDKFSQLSYEANYGEKPHGDIHSVAIADIPAHDILCGGFPCQPFSIAGVSKKNSLGRAHGFDDAKQGNLFFAIADIIDYHRPAAFVLENVKNLQSHDKGNTFRVIYETLTKHLGYTVKTKVINGISLVPQNRERVFLIGFREPRNFEFPVFPQKGPRLDSILEKNPDPKYTLTDHLWNYLQNYAAKHKAAGNGFGFGLVSGKDTSRTLSARYHKDGSEILIDQGPKKNPRRLTPRECARLMGYPDTYKIIVSDTQAYRQFGNSVVVPVVELLAEAVIETLGRPVGTPAELVLYDRGAKDRTATVQKSVNYAEAKKKPRK
jgi:DNA (cytosine-5)-methyltransferase 1